ncbi:MAG: hypothetical protein JXB32_00215 [Deltaproteobacteria bacterium]|nr:hypothetical protein [Deltaproteobacteria bacterium]
MQPRLQAVTPSTTRATTQPRSPVPTPGTPRSPGRPASRLFPAPPPWAACIAFAALVAAPGCFDRDLAGVEPGTTTGVTVNIEQLGVVRVDLVVLVDNSGSMLQEQEALTARFPELIRELIDPALDPDTGRPTHPPVEDLNLGVISSDMGVAGRTDVNTCQANPVVGDDGCFRTTPSTVVPGCGSSYTGFLRRNPDNAATYDADRMAQDFTCLATLGTDGCGFEQQLKALRKALTVNAADGGCNRGFLRDDSLLGLIVVSDEDDCSVAAEHPEMFDPDPAALGHLNLRCANHPELVERVSDYVAAFRALRANPDRLVLGLIVGVPLDADTCIGQGDELGGCLALAAMQAVENPARRGELIPSCDTTATSGMGLAFPPRRFVELAQAFGANAYVDSICKSDWTDAIRGITRNLVARLPSACFPRDLSFDPGTCAADCQVVETLEDDGPCEVDPGCLDCPPATADDLYGLLPCRDAFGAACEPLKRDLGVVRTPEGVLRRQCLLRQAPRAVTTAGCADPTTEGWYYVPREQSPDDCPQLVFARGDTGSLVEPNSSAELRCLAEL